MMVVAGVQVFELVLQIGPPPAFPVQSELWRHCTQLFEAVLQTEPAPLPSQSEDCRHCTHVDVVVSQTVPAALPVQSLLVEHPVGAATHALFVQTWPVEHSLFVLQATQTPAVVLQYAPAGFPAQSPSVVHELVQTPVMHRPVAQSLF